MDTKTIINSVGLLLTIVGVYLVYLGSPIHFDIIDGGDFKTDWKEEARKTARKNRQVKIGVYLVIGGTLFQLISNIVPERQAQ